LKIIYGKESDLKHDDAIYLTEPDIILYFSSDSYERTITVINKIEKQKINEVRFSHLFKYSDFSLWWFMHPTIFPSLNRSLDFISGFERIIKNEKISSVKVVGEFDKLDLLKQLCKKWDITLSYSKLAYLIYSSKGYLRSKLDKYIFSYIYSKKYKKRLSVFLSRNKNLPHLTDKIIFAIHTLYRRTVYDYNENKLVSHEYIQGPLIDLIKRLKFDVVGLDFDYTFRGNEKILEERLSDPFPWFPAEYVLENFSKKGNLDEFIREYEKIIQSPEFRILFVFNEINFWSQLKDDFRKLTYVSHLPLYVRMIEAFTNLLSTEKPRAIFIPYETGPLALSIILACEKNGIKSIGIQHGATFKNNSDYSHDSFRTKENPFGMPLPNTTLLFGTYINKVLTEDGKYPIDRFVVFGNPEFFCLNNLMKSLESKNLHQKYNIPSDKKVILFTSSKLQKYYKAYGSVTYDEQVWRFLLKNFGNDEKFFIVLKPHPDENTVIYQDIMKEYALTNARIIEGQLFELLHLSSVVISIVSTTLLDSLCLQRPTIRVKFANMKPFLPYDEYQAVVSTELNDLARSVIELLNSDSIRNKLLQNSMKFVKEQFNIPEENPEEIIAKILDVVNNTSTKT